MSKGKSKIHVFGNMNKRTNGGTYINVKRFGIFTKLKYHETVWFL